MRLAEVEQIIISLAAEAKLCGDRNGEDALSFVLELVAERRAEERVGRAEGK